MECLLSLKVRRRTLIYGISDGKRENWSESENTVQQMLSSILWLYSINMNVEHAQKIGQNQKGGEAWGKYKTGGVYFPLQIN